MARAESVTKLPLSTWARIMGFHPLHFEQVQLDDNPHCSQLVMQHEWQNNDAVSREEIARAIAESESKIENYLGYRLAPCWEVDEWQPIRRPFVPEMVKFNSGDIRGYRDTIQAEWGYFISGGIRSKEAIQEDAAIVWTDVDGDGYFETGTVVVSTIVLDPNEISIYYPEKDGADEWEIRPINVSIVSNSATITFRREQTVREFILESFSKETSVADGYDDDDFLEEVDVYRVYNDPVAQVSFLWEPLNSNCGSCGGDGCEACAYFTQTGCLILRGDPRNSIVGYAAGSWNSDDDIFEGANWEVNRAPDIARLYYYSGWRKKNQRYVSRMDPQWERAVAYMATAMLDRPPCDCVSQNWNKWRQDLTLQDGDQDGNPVFREPGSGLGLQRGITDNPFGTRRGELYAWQKVRDLAKFTSVSLRA